MVYSKKQLMWNLQICTAFLLFIYQALIVFSFFELIQ